MPIVLRCLIVIIWSVYTVIAQAQTLPKRALLIKQNRLVVEVAASVEQRQKGLMYRSNLDDGKGMLFVFDEKVMPCFWMKNTVLPLSLVYVSEEKSITQIENLLPESETEVCSNMPIRYAIEVPQGWFQRHNILQGDTVEGLP